MEEYHGVLTNGTPGGLLTLPTAQAHVRPPLEGHARVRCGRRRLRHHQRGSRLSAQRLPHHPPRSHPPDHLPARLRISGGAEGRGELTKESIRTCPARPPRRNHSRSGCVSRDTKTRRPRTWYWNKGSMAHVFGVEVS